MKINKKNKIPTIEEFNSYKPKRLDFKWIINDEGNVSLIVKKFNGKFGKSFCKLIKKDNTFTANLDRLGSIVWKYCNGLNSVKDIIDHLMKEFPNEKDIDQRIYYFLQQMKNLHYIDF
jgi:hypothetical protein